MGNLGSEVSQLDISVIGARAIALFITFISSQIRYRLDCADALYLVIYISMICL